MPTSDSDQVYDVFISYSHADKEWVWDWLVPRLKEAGLAVCTDRESFDVGVPALVNMENAVAASCHTLLVLTPAWVQSEWTRFEVLLVQHEDPGGLLRRTLPVLRQPCDLPRRIAMLNHANLTGEADDEMELGRLLDALRGVRRLPDADPFPSGRVRPLEQSLHFYANLRDTLEKGDFQPSTVREGNRLTVVRPKVAIICDLPIAFGEGSCQIEFSNVARRGLTIRLTHQNILGDLMMGLYTSPYWQTRRFLRQIDDDVFEAKLGQATIILSEGEAHDLCACVDEVCQEYKRIIIEAENILEAWDYEPMQSDDGVPGFYLLSVRQWLWELMKKFADEFDYGRGDSDWHIFYFQIGVIRVGRGLHDHAFICPKADINIWSSLLPTGYVDLVYEVADWNLRWVESGDVVSWTQAVGPQGIWTARYTKEWILEEFIPKVRTYHARDYQTHQSDPHPDILDKHKTMRIPFQEISKPKELATYLHAVQSWLHRHPGSIAINTSLLRPYYTVFTDLARKTDPSTISIDYIAAKLNAVEARFEGAQREPRLIKSPCQHKWTYYDVMDSLDRHVTRINQSEYEDSFNADRISCVFIAIIENGAISFSQAQLNAAKQALLPLWEQSRFEWRYVLPNQ